MAQQKNLTPIKSCSEDARLSGAIRNLHAVTFYRHKMYQIIGYFRNYVHYDVIGSKQNDLLIIKDSNLSLEKLVNSPN